jgi:hypothetical protein
MKRIVYILSLFFLTALIGCQSNSSDPTSALKSFLEAVENKDFASAKQWATDESKSLLDLLAMANPSNSKDSALTQSATVQNMIFGKPNIQGERATISVQQKENQKPVTFTLKQIDNNWKVAFDKNTLLGMGMEQINEKGAMKKDQLDNALNEIKKIGIDSMKKAYEQEMLKLDTALQSLKDSVNPL